MTVLFVALLGCGGGDLDLGKDSVGAVTQRAMDGAMADGTDSGFGNAPPTRPDAGSDAGAAVPGVQSPLHVDCAAWDPVRYIVSGPCPAPVDWATVLSQDAGTDWHYVVNTSDADGNLYVLLRNSGKVALADHEVGTDGRGTLLVSYTAAGDVRWAQQLDSTGGQQALAMAGSNVCVYLGYANDTLPNELDRDVQSDGLNYGVTCFDPSGHALWSRRLSSPIVTDVTLAGDAHGNLYVEGTFVEDLRVARELTAVERAPDGGTFLGDVFLASYDANGAPRFLRSFGGANSDGGGAVLVTSDDAVAITGTFRTSIDIGGTELSASGAFFDAVFLARLDRDGNVQWAVRVGEDAFILMPTLASGPDGSVAVTLEPEDRATQLYRFDATGTLVASRTHMEDWPLTPWLVRAPDGNGYVEVAGCDSTGYGQYGVCIEQLDDDLIPRSNAVYTFDETDFDTRQDPLVTLSASSKGLLIAALSGGESTAQLLLHVQLAP